MNPPAGRGQLLVVEGIDGAGKSTVVHAIAAYCAAHALPHVVSREPTSGKWGTILRTSASTGRLPLEEELQLFLRDRAEHVETLIAPALALGKVVILDRYYFSTAAYQGARGADPEAILAENERFSPAPDLVLLLDVPPRAGLQRIRARGDSPDEFEDADPLARTREIFLSINRPFIRRIDASQPAERVSKECLEAVQARFPHLANAVAANPAL